MSAFAELFYRPERMTLVISGPAPIELEKLAGKLPPAWQGRAADAARTRSAARWPRSRRPAPPRSDLPTRKTVAVFAPELWMAWRVPPAVGIAAGRLEVVARVVDRMLSRRLDPDGTNDVLDVAAWAAPRPPGERGRLPLQASVARRRRRGSATKPRGALEALADVDADSHQAAACVRATTNAVTEAILRTALAMDSVKERTKAQAELAHAEAGAQIAQLIDALAQDRGRRGRRLRGPLPEAGCGACRVAGARGDPQRHARASRG